MILRIREYQELADGSIGSLDRNDKQPVYSHLVYHSHSHIHITHFERRKSRCIATVDVSSTSFQTCGHDVIATFDVLHLLAHHRGSVAFSLRLRTKRVNLRDMGRNLKLGLDFENTDGAEEFALSLSGVMDGASSPIANFIFGDGAARIGYRDCWQESHRTT